MGDDDGNVVVVLQWYLSSISPKKTVDVWIGQAGDPDFALYLEVNVIRKQMIIVHVIHVVELIDQLSHAPWSIQVATLDVNIRGDRQKAPALSLAQPSRQAETCSEGLCSDTGTFFLWHSSAELKEEALEQNGDVMPSTDAHVVMRVRWM